MKKGDFTTYTVKGTEWFARLALLNLFWLLFSLPIITIVPSTFAMFSVLKKWVVNKEMGNSFSSFKNLFVENFKESYRTGWPFILIGVILFVNLLFFGTYTFETTLFYILKYANYILTGIFFLLWLHTFALKQITELETFQTIAVSFVLILSQPLITLLIVLAAGVLFVFFILFPGFSFFFSGSALGLIVMSATNKGYQRLLDKSKRSGNS